MQIVGEKHQQWQRIVGGKHQQWRRKTPVRHFKLLVENINQGSGNCWWKTPTMASTPTMAFKHQHGYPLLSTFWQSFESCQTDQDFQWTYKHTSLGI
ncbi:hypothetical protein [Gelidibacter salicanalis]|uniref:Uncharacterized protein n=1 Tax=Gelidibacter salicanalis TaxID=291193 RepID=A0A934NIL3_9FLAO|nr:hypothetical protein [Gelidibacter salicanalis]MBJ7882256.1 hypothetical protein [Gelidibacter salicanalis]